MNRYADLIVVDNYGFPEADNNDYPDLFPIKSIVEPNRPTTGLATARVGVSEVFDNRSDIPDDDREYVASPANKYKYWASPTASELVLTTGSYLIDNAGPFVKYGEVVGANKVYKNVKANKIVVTFDLSQNSPVNLRVWLRTGSEGVNFNDTIDVAPIATNPPVDSKGQVILYYQADGTWSTLPGTYIDAEPCELSTIYAQVDSLDKPGHFANVIEISPRIERDISDRVIDFNTSYELGEDDQVSPVGTISSNTGSISISNAKDGAVYPDPGYFESSTLYGPLDANVKFMIDFGVDTTPQGGAGLEWTRLATMYSDEWQRSEDTMSIDLKDASKFLQEIQPTEMLFQDLSVGEIIWRILDSVGMNNWEYNVAADAANMRVQYFWTNPEETVWRNIQDLCRGTQSVAFIDEDGVFQIETRDSAFTIPTDPAEILEFRSDEVVDKLPNIEEISFGDQFQVNSVTINYRPTDLAKDSLGRPISEIVWQPEGTVVLRSTSLYRSFLKGDASFFIDGKDAALWPYTALVNIGGELIRYSGKQYSYIKPDGTWAQKYLYSAEEKNALDNDPTRCDVGQNWRNYFVGRFLVKERGVGITSEADHYVDIPTWYINPYYGAYGGTQRKWTGGMKYTPQDGFLRLETNKTFMNSAMYTVERGTPGYTTIDTVYGTRLRFPTSPTGAWFNSAGLFFFGDASHSVMYTVEVTPTYTIEGGKFRVTSNEIRVLKRKNGELHQLNKGYAFGVVRGQWVDLDVRVERPAAGPLISVSVNGRLAVVVQDLGTVQGAAIPATNRCGIYTRGWTACDFEYFYAVPGGLVIDGIPETTDFLSQVRGGYESRQLSYYVMNWRINGAAGILKRNAYKDRYIEEFGQIVHEVREYDVKFEKAPVLYSSLYVSNEDQIVTPEYVGNAFGATFTIANSSRFNSVVNGEDTVTYGADNSVEQKMVITGRTIQQQDEKKYQVKDDAAITARGEITLEISSDWIQSETAAKAIGDWIVTHWAEPADTLELTVFGNPLVRVGDVISVSYAPKGLTDVKFVVLKAAQGWDDGLQTSLICRKCPQPV
jgi:hypothetical protein